MLVVAKRGGRDRGPVSQQWFELVSEVIRIGIERKSTYINLRLGAYDAKLSIGADLVPLHVYSKSSVGVINYLMKLFQ